jgi:hypothetical protein
VNAGAAEFAAMRAPEILPLGTRQANLSHGQSRPDVLRVRAPRTTRIHPHRGGTGCRQDRQRTGAFAPAVGPRTSWRSSPVRLNGPACRPEEREHFLLPPTRERHVALAARRSSVLFEKLLPKRLRQPDPFSRAIRVERLRRESRSWIDRLKAHHSVILAPRMRVRLWGHSATLAQVTLYCRSPRLRGHPEACPEGLEEVFGVLVRCVDR